MSSSRSAVGRRFWGMTRWAIFACGGRRRAGSRDYHPGGGLVVGELRPARARACVRGCGGRAAGGWRAGRLGGGCGLGAGGGGRAPGAALHGLPPASFPVRDHGQDNRAATPPGFGARMPAGVREVDVAALQLACAVRLGPGGGGGAEVGLEVGDGGRTAGSRGRQALLGTGRTAARDAHGRTAPAGGVQTHCPTASRHPLVQLAHRGLRHPGLPPVPCLRYLPPLPSVPGVCAGGEATVCGARGEGW